VKVCTLKKYVDHCWDSWTLPQKRTAEKLLKTLEGKIPAPLKQNLPGLLEKNAPSALENGEFMTDVLATWIKKGFVAGPFPNIPLVDFRANPLMAAVQKTKVRPILNLSAPKGRSFNDAVNEWDIENLTMSTPKLFGESLIKAGKGALFSKTDIQDAYKLIPNPVDEWKYYGFSWLGQFFLDTTTVFGSKVAPASFDTLPETIVNITCSVKKIPKQWIHRQLDDVPIVSPKGSGITETFTKAYAKICGELGVPLADPCPNHEKAFGASTHGIVLGIGFDSETLEWYLAKPKADNLQQCIDEFLTKKVCSLLEAQILHGKMSAVAQMSNFLMGFRFHLVGFLKKFGVNEKEVRLIPRELKDDLWIWKKVINTARTGVPLGESYGEPPLFPLNFVSDAAGAAFEWHQGKCRNVSIPGDRRVASIGFLGEEICMIGIIRWPITLLTRDKSRKGTFMGSKSGTLEMVGLLIPFVTCPKFLRGRHIVLGVDNVSVVYAWSKKYCKNDPETSLLIRTLHVIEAYLHCKIYVTHVRRLSTNIAAMADRLSRRSTVTPEDRAWFDKVPVFHPWGSLGKWLETPVLNWNLPLLVLQDIKALCDQ
jgi:hypothetical protein